VLKNQFAQFAAGFRARGQDLIFVCHEKQEKVGDEGYYCPDIVGGSYNTTMTHADLVGRMHFIDGKRVISFNPTDRWMAKTPPCGWSTIPLPDFAAEPKFMAGLIAKAKESMGQISGESAKAAGEVGRWKADIATIDSFGGLNGALDSVLTLTGPISPQVKKILWARAQKLGFPYDAKAKQFVAPKEEEVPA
jgi:AAA domain